MIYYNNIWYSVVYRIILCYDHHPPVTQVLTAHVGTTAYMAPQIFRKSYNHACDLWSSGIMIIVIVIVIIIIIISSSGSSSSSSSIQYIIYYTYYTILYYTTLYYTILHCTILYYTILYCTVLCCAVLYYTILYYTILYYTILYYTILYYTILLIILYHRSSGVIMFMMLCGNQGHGNHAGRNHFATKYGDISGSWKHKRM